MVQRIFGDPEELRKPSTQVRHRAANCVIPTADVPSRLVDPEARPKRALGELTISARRQAANIQLRSAV